uniref:Metalloendopeptidase n=1 Tax=Rhabditophanes sp. KR3021 TaxID=114890 RepID=A0AC35U634_9BILA
MLLLFIILNCFYVGSFWEIKQKEEESQGQLRYGDIMLTEEQRDRIDFIEKTKILKLPVRSNYRRSAISNTWKDARIPYRLSKLYNFRDRDTILKSMKIIESVSCFKFVNRAFESDFLDIAPLDGCYSYVGKIGGAQTLSLSNGCIYDFIIVHEILHSIGFEHEHQRYDRDNFIKVRYDNIDQTQLHNFDKILLHEVTTFDYKYDYKSIMHYDSTAFGKHDSTTKKRLVTMEPISPNVVLNDNFALSLWDIEKLNMVGNCPISEVQTDKTKGVIDNTIEEEQLIMIKKPMNCEDKTPLCYAYMMKGLCLNGNYAVSMMKLCSKTCFNCL